MVSSRCREIFLKGFLIHNYRVLRCCLAVERITANGCIRNVLRCVRALDGIPHTSRANMIAARGRRSEGKEPDRPDLGRPGGGVDYQNPSQN